MESFIHLTDENKKFLVFIVVTLNRFYSLVLFFRMFVDFFHSWNIFKRNQRQTKLNSRLVAFVK